MLLPDHILSRREVDVTSMLLNLFITTFHRVYGFVSRKKIF